MPIPWFEVVEVWVADCRSDFKEVNSEWMSMRRVVKLEVQSNVREGAVARRIVSAALKDDHANAEEVADVELVTSELVTNAVEASNADDAVTFSMDLSDDDVCLSVANQGDDFEPKVKMPDGEDPRGRGLAIVGAIGDLTVKHDDGVTTVSVDIPLSAKEQQHPRDQGG